MNGCLESLNACARDGSPFLAPVTPRLAATEFLGDLLDLLHIFTPFFS
jgi:hypothetical protein